MTEGIETGFLETMIKSRLHAFGDLGRIPEVPEVGRTKHRGFCEALTHTHDVAVIAEVKKASPSAGSIAPGVKVVEQAAAYERGGAVAVSVLTEPVSFGGSFEDLDAVAHGVSIPVLCKDFVCTPHQLELAHCYGADAVLLMVSVLGNAIGAYISAAEELGLETLVSCPGSELARSPQSPRRSGEFATSGRARTQGRVYGSRCERYQRSVSGASSWAGRC